MSDARNCACPDRRGHHADLVAEPQAALDLRREYLTALEGKDAKWRGMDVRGLAQPGAGKMFAVMRAAKEGQTHWRYAFSGQLEQAWVKPGWVPPIFDVDAWKTLESSHDPTIQDLTRQIRALQAGPDRAALIAERKQRSNALLDAYLKLYTIQALNGARAPVTALFPGKRPPTGAGDCCAPKLITAAWREGLVIQSLTEIFLGGAPASQERQCGDICPPCLPKCAPLLDFMLCPHAQDLEFV